MMQPRFTPYSSQHPNGLGFAGPFVDREAAQAFLTSALQRRGKDGDTAGAHIAEYSTIVQTSDPSPVVMNVYRDDCEPAPPPAPPALRLAILYMPTQHTKGYSGTTDAAVELGVLGFNIVKRFGGYTSSTATGAWRDPKGKTIIEPVIRYEIAMEDTEANRNALRDMARWCGRALGQHSVMLVLPNGVAEIIELEAA